MQRGIISTEVKGGATMAANKNLSAIDEKFQKDKLSFDLVTNDDLVCKDCRNRFKDEGMPCNTSKCAKYEVKPDEVLDGGECIEYNKE